MTQCSASLSDFPKKSNKSIHKQENVPSPPSHYKRAGNQTQQGHFFIFFAVEFGEFCVFLNILVFVCSLLSCSQGFGTLTAEHWLGNEYVYQLTSQRQYALRVELTDWDGLQAFSLYDRFQIGSEKQNYR